MNAMPLSMEFGDTALSDTPTLIVSFSTLTSLATQVGG